MSLDRVRGWFADRSDEMPGHWAPHLQTDGLILPVSVWFDTREQCEAFIRAELVGQGWVDGPRRYRCPDCEAPAEEWCRDLVTGDKRLFSHADRLRYQFGGWPA